MSTAKFYFLLKNPKKIYKSHLQRGRAKSAESERNEEKKHVTDFVEL